MSPALGLLTEAKSYACCHDATILTNCGQKDRLPTILRRRQLESRPTPDSANRATPVGPGRGPSHTVVGVSLSEVVVSRPESAVGIGVGGTTIVMGHPASGVATKVAPLHVDHEDDEAGFVVSGAVRRQFASDLLEGR
jgi:hypothetical protein